jgi:hypothetical protein
MVGISPSARKPVNGGLAQKGAASTARADSSFEDYMKFFKYEKGTAVSALHRSHRVVVPQFNLPQGESVSRVMNGGTSPKDDSRIRYAQIIQRGPEHIYRLCRSEIDMQIGVLLSCSSLVMHTSAA